MRGFMPSDTSIHVECLMEPSEGLNFASNVMNDNLKHFSESMKKQENKDRKSCKASGIPNFASFKAAMRMNLIRNNCVATEHTQLAEKAHGSNLGSVK